MARSVEEALLAAAGTPLRLSPEHRVIIGLVGEGSRVLDLGCGEGDLLRALQVVKGVRAEGIELSEPCIRACVAKGLLNVHQGDLDEGLADYPDQSVDYVILTNTMQALRQPAFLLGEMARVGRRCIVGFPNFAHWQLRWQLAVRGRMPVTARLPYAWHESPNIHLTTLADFRDLCRSSRLRILEELPLRTVGDRCRRVRFLPNLRADEAVFVLERDLR